MYDVDRRCVLRRNSDVLNEAETRRGDGRDLHVRNRAVRIFCGLEPVYRMKGVRLWPSQWEIVCGIACMRQNRGVLLLYTVTSLKSPEFHVCFRAVCDR
jgi:hypothetical protein